jgi:hypothetical protein
MEHAILKLPVPRPDVVFSEVGDGAVLLSTRDEVYYGLNSVGSRIWDLLPAHDSLEQLVDALAADYPDVDREVIRADVVELLDTLMEHGLVDQR